MKPDPTPSIHSFILRFVIEDAADDDKRQPVYHGAIRHIQSAEEMNFGRLKEALEFMRHFVPLEEADSEEK